MEQLAEEALALRAGHAGPHVVDLNRGRGCSRSEGDRQTRREEFPVDCGGQLVAARAPQQQLADGRAVEGRVDAAVAEDDRRADRSVGAGQQLLGHRGAVVMGHQCGAFHAERLPDLEDQVDLLAHRPPVTGRLVRGAEPEQVGGDHPVVGGQVGGDPGPVERRARVAVEQRHHRTDADVTDEQLDGVPRGRHHRQAGAFRPPPLDIRRHRIHLRLCMPPTPGLSVGAATAAGRSLRSRAPGSGPQHGVGAIGLEPMTLCLQNRCSSQLS